MNQAFPSGIWFRSLFLAILVFGLFGCQDGSISSQSPTTQLDSVSYALGMDIARFYQKQDVPLNSALVYQGIQDILNQEKPLLSDEEALEVLGAFRKQQEAKQQVDIARLATENLAKSEMFFRANREKEGIVVLASGLQYRVLNSGTGASPLPSNVVKVNYSGKVLDGALFDDSASKGGPDEIEVEKALPGLTEALLLMKPGDKWELFIPPGLAYGQQGFQQIIPPNSVLIYELELLEILR